jgi:hypothetical protein
MIISQVSQAASDKNAAEDSLLMVPGMTLNIGPFISRKVDSGLMPLALKVKAGVLAAYDLRPFPNIAIEVAYQNENEFELLQQLLTDLSMDLCSNSHWNQNLE